MRVRAAEYLIRQRVAALRRVLPAARAGDPTSLHYARVATRRLRAALPLVGSRNKAQKVARCVRRLTRVLGPVRELDVALLVLDELESRGDVPPPAIDRLRTSLADERQRLHARVRQELDRLDFSKLRKRALDAAQKTDDVPDVRARAARDARRLALAIDHAAGLYLPDRLHDVRIGVKKLRYSLELGTPDLKRSAPRVRTLKQAQDLLGRMHDLEVLITRTRAIQSSPGASTLKVSADLDRLVRRLETECRQLHGHYMAMRRTLLSLCQRLTATGKPRERARSSAA